eukprot:5616804-Amphidinium_carterae.2
MSLSISQGDNDEGQDCHIYGLENKERLLSRFLLLRSLTSRDHLVVSSTGDLSQKVWACRFLCERID